MEVSQLISFLSLLSKFKCGVNSALVQCTYCKQTKLGVVSVPWTSCPITWDKWVFLSGLKWGLNITYIDKYSTKLFWTWQRLSRKTFGLAHNCSSLPKEKHLKSVFFSILQVSHGGKSQRGPTPPGDMQVWSCQGSTCFDVLIKKNFKKSHVLFGKSGCYCSI